MAVHRYWRFYCAANNGGPNVSIAGIRFGNSSSWVVVPPHPVVVSSGTGEANLWDWIFPGDGVTTVWTSVGGAPQWIMVDFWGGVDASVMGFTLQAPMTNLLEMPRDYALQWSDDGVTWGTEYSTSGQTGWTPGEVRTIPGAFSSGWIMTPNKNIPAKQLSVDGDLTTRWTTGGFPSVGDVVHVDMLAPVTIDRVIVSSALSPTDIPVDGILETSDDNVTWTAPVPWHGADAVGGVLSIDITPVEARYFRLTVVTPSPPGNWWSIHELAVRLHSSLIPPIIPPPVDDTGPGREYRYQSTSFPVLR